MRFYSHLASLSVALLAVSAVPRLARAQEAAGKLTVQAGPPEAHAEADDVYEPRGNLWEVGVFGGLLFLSDRSDFRSSGSSPFPNFAQPTPEFGLRVAYFPLSFLGLEVEGMGGAGRLDDTGDNDGVAVWAARGHLILQVPTSRVTLFALGGAGRLGVRSDLTGSDDDPAFHFGGGLKIAVDPKVSLRLDVRDTITDARPEADTPHHIEGLAGVSLVFGRPAEKPADTDRDGVVDLQDQCPVEPGPPPTGCPVRDHDADSIVDSSDQCPYEPGPAPSGCPVRDADGDGVPDATDECANVAGVAPTGCPDGDGDGILDRDDKCPETAGIAPDGCPPDSDGDGYIDPKDRCPTEPETKNGFEDEDGCPDQLPDQVKKFAGVIQGIEFDTGKATVRPTSLRVLNEAARILTLYPSLRVQVIGHTDNRGPRELNTRLSLERANAVKSYLVEDGIAPDRVLTRGAGPDEPLEDNKTAAGRQKNRRIEFRIVLTDPVQQQSP
jgi:outer membrane protein OmpA-like peptidoglycan-associated protein